MESVAFPGKPLADPAVAAGGSGIASDAKGQTSGHPLSAHEQYLSAVYSELRALAESFLHGERDGHTLQATALVHEAYLRLAGHKEVKCHDRAHFFALAAQVMRRILVDHARAKKRLKRAEPGARVILLTETAAVVPERELDLLALEDAMNQLTAEAPLTAQIVEMRFFAGLSELEIARLLEMSDRTVRRHWTYARAWLFRHLVRGEACPPGATLP